MWWIFRASLWGDPPRPTVERGGTRCFEHVDLTAVLETGDPQSH